MADGTIKYPNLKRQNSIYNFFGHNKFNSVNNLTVKYNNLMVTIVSDIVKYLLNPFWLLIFKVKIILNK